MTKKQKKVLFRIIFATVILVVASLLKSIFNINEIVFAALCLVSYAVIGFDILRKAFLGIIHGEVFDECFLMAVATIGALALGDFKEGVAVMIFYQVGELFQSVAVGKSRKNIAKLMDIRPDIANLIKEDGSVEEVDPDEVPIGSVILVRPGEKIPIDGYVIKGETSLNTSALTGESLPRSVTVNDQVISGSVNIEGVIEVKTTKEFGESTVSKILDLVENSSMKKAKAENFITKFARVYTPIVCYLALALCIIPTVFVYFSSGEFTLLTWLKRSLTFLVISCPCALVISIPLSFFGGIGGASSKGILVKGSNYLEALARVKIIAFDKTGTLTKGNFNVTSVTSYDLKYTKEDVLKIAAHAEYFSNHPIAKSIKEAFNGEVDESKISNVKEVPGKGISLTFDGKEVLVGNNAYLEDMGIEQVMVDETGTLVHIIVDKRHVGLIVISDEIKETARQALDNLKKAGIKRLVLLTGDATRVATKVAEALGINEFFAELLPEQKVSHVEEILESKKPGEVFAFVGDGVNDAPVLSRADIGIAMGALGSDAAIEAADIVLMDDNPLKIAEAIKIAKKCIRICNENIVFAIFIKLVCLALGAFGIANMWMAIFADVGVMVIAVLNAIRCLHS